MCRACLAQPKPLAAEFFCASCQTPFLNAAPLDEKGQCAFCRLGIPGFDSVYTYGSYEDSLRTLIHLFKYEKITPLAKPLGNLLALAIPRQKQFDVIVPMPLHWRKRWARGFNQSEILAKEIARRWGVPVRTVVKRTKATAPQAGLTNAKRRLNVRGAFSVSGNRKLKGLRVLLIDDVLTTGATASACAAALKRAGAVHVSVAAVARTDRRIGLEEFRYRETAPLAVAARSQTV